MIPQIIHYYWISGGDYPEKIRMCVSFWEKNLPGYELRKWDASNFDMNTTAWTREAFTARAYAFAADYIRFYALYTYGGIYLDCDVEALKPFDDLLDYDTFFGYEYTALPEAAVVWVASNQPWLKACLSWYQTRHFLDERGWQRRVIAPLVMKQAFENTTGIRLMDSGAPLLRGSTAILPCDYFSPKNNYSGRIEKTDHTYTVHHFESAWLRKNCKTRVKKWAHLLLIKVLGKVRYNALMYHIRFSHRGTGNTEGNAWFAI